tara:strand:- start:4159 stop:4959 length:801 start_codon:yes stop_codon:yes gene_type:complete
MKELYSFDVERKIEEQVPYTRKTKNGPIESTKKVKKTIKNKVFLKKPTGSDIENAEFFYGQKYNEFINAGFLTRAMLGKKMGDLGGLQDKTTEEELQSAVMDNIEAARTIEFYGGSKNLTEAQKEKLEEAKKTFVNTRRNIHNYETSIREQFNQTADSKAEQKLIEWFVFNFSFYEDSVDDKKQSFPLFEGEGYKEKRLHYLQLIEEDNEITEPSFLKSKKIFDESFETLIRVVSIWYNKMASDQKSIDKVLKELFDPDESEENES